MDLANAMLVQMALNFAGLGNGKLRGGLLGVGGQLLVENALAKQNAVIANVNGRTGDKLLYLRVRLAAETAKRNVSRTCHNQN
jgi:hypothetical protein